MDFENLIASIYNNSIIPLNSITNTLSIPQAIETLQPLILFVAGMVIYSIFVFKFYKFISRKDIFRISKGMDHSIIKKLAYTLEYIFLFPILAFFWFLVISMLLSILAEVVAIGNIFTVSMATLATIRVSAYYKEDLSRDIAKLIPFALMATLLVDLTSFSSKAPFGVLNQLPLVLDTLVYYFIFIVVLEFILRLIFHGKPRIYVES